jgi:SAM-dependent methyltransferase
VATHSSVWKSLQTIAKKYGYDENHNVRYLELARAVDRAGVTHVVVLGCGKGVLESILPLRVHSVSLDISQPDLRAACEISRGKPTSNFLRADIFHLPFSPMFQTQAVIISEVLEHVERDDLVLMAAHRLLRPDGLLLLTVPNFRRLINRVTLLLQKKAYYMSEDHLREYTMPAILRLLQNTGFAPVSIAPVYLRLIKERQLRKYVGLANPLRQVLLMLFPGFGTYFLIVARPRKFP